MKCPKAADDIGIPIPDHKCVFTAEATSKIRVYLLQNNNLLNVMEWDISISWC